MSFLPNPRSNGVTEGIIGTACVIVGGGVCVPYSDEIWKYFFGSASPKWFEDLVACVFAVAAVCFISVVIRPLWRSFLGKLTGTQSSEEPRALGKNVSAREEKLTIYVARLEGDDAKCIYQKRIIALLSEELGKTFADVMAADVTLSGDYCKWEEDREKEVEQRGKSILKKLNGQLIVCGSVFAASGITYVDLRFLSKEQGLTQSAQSVFNWLRIEEGVLEKLGAVIAVYAVKSIDGVDSSDAKYKAHSLIPLAQRLQSLFGNMPSSLKEYDKGLIAWSYGNSQDVIGSELNDFDRRAEAIRAYRYAEPIWNALNESYMLWACLNNLGVVLLDSGQFKEAKAVLIQALEVISEESHPRQWALSQINSSRVTIRIAEQTQDIAVLHGAIASAEKDLGSIDAQKEPQIYAMQKSNIGFALTRYGMRLGDPSILEHAIRYLEEALSGFSRGADPIDWSKLSVDLALALSDYGQLTASYEVFQKAIKILEEVLDEITADGLTSCWVNAKINLGMTLMRLNSNSEKLQSSIPATQGLGSSIRAIQEALEVIDEKVEPKKWALAKGNVALATMLMAARENSADLMSDAINEIDPVVTKLSPETAAYERAGALMIKGVCICVKGVTMSDVSLLRNAIEHLTAASNVLTNQCDPARNKFINHLIEKALAAIEKLSPPMNRGVSVAPAITSRFPSFEAYGKIVITDGSRDTQTFLHSH